MSSSPDSGEKGRGTIITFYSYKGGTGRSMALANVAWILASNGRKVLVIDWDLEAPGLHRYFAPFLVDRELTSTEGLIDFVNDYASETMTRLPEGEKLDEGWYRQHADILRYAVSLDWKFPDGGTVDLVPAGRQGSSYSTRVNLFNWQTFYDKLGGGAFLEAARELMREEYDYVLIDSRTGVSDTSGICTVQMPDALVVCFTLNNQSIEGASAVAESVFQQRSQRPLRIFPVQTRVEPFEKRKLDLRKEYARSKFARFPDHLSSRRDRDVYLEDVQFQYIPFYAYEELLSIFGDRPEESISLLKAAERLTSYLTDGRVTRLEAPPSKEQREQILAIYEGRALEVDPAVAHAEAAYSRLSPEEQTAAQRLFKRLVRVASPSEGGEDAPIRCRLEDLDPKVRETAGRLAADQIVTIENDPTLGEIVRITNDVLVRKWEPLRHWLDEDREFLLWRRKLNGIISEWARLREDRSALLTGALLDEAKSMRAGRESDLNASELRYIDRSIHEEQEQIRLRLQQKAEQEKVRSSREELEQQSIALQQAERKQKSQRRLIIGGAVAVVLISIIVGYFIQSGREQRIEVANRQMLDGVELFKNGNYDEAILKFNDAVNLNPSNDAAFVGRGRVRLAQNDYDQALADFSEALKLNPGNSEALIGRGNAHLGSKNWDAGIADFSKALEMNQSAEAYYNRGRIYEYKKDYARAIEDFRAAIKLSAEDPKPLVGIGNIYLQQGDNERALGNFSQALALDPNLFEAYLGSGNAYLAGGRNELALSSYDKAIQLNNLEPYALLNRGIAYRNLGRKDSALTDCRKALDLAPAGSGNDQIRQSALSCVESLATAPVEPQPTIAKVYLQYQDKRDLPTLNAIRRALESQANGAFVVADKPELVTQPTTGDIRYYYDEDEKTARRVKRIVEDSMSKRGLEMKLELRVLKRLASRVPQGWIEVWLPPLSTQYPVQQNAAPVYQRRVPDRPRS
ncbi:MAG: tetratricopeptide repeat protein [Acidobacteriota bacterium]|nr:MAG: tetratricopeptide repeat protein [Acidobacteriota bacterium]